MRKLLLFFAAFSLLISPGYPARVYMKKVYTLHNFSGSYKKTCKFFHKKVEIVEEVGGDTPSSSYRVLPTSYSGSSLGLLVSAAAHGTLKTTPFAICDGGSLSLRAYRASGSYFTLKSFEDCGATKKVRSGTASAKLRAIADKYCETYDPDKR